MRADLFRFVVVIGLALTGAGCGFVSSAIPRFSVIKHAVTVEEASGHWVLQTNELPALVVDGFVPKAGEEVFITLRTNGTYSCRMIAQSWSGTNAVDVIEEEGTWSMDYDATDYYRNRVYFTRIGNGGVWSIHVASDDGRMIFWTSWGDPDVGTDLVFERRAAIEAK